MRIDLRQDSSATVDADPIEALLEGRYVDAETGRPVTVDTRKLVVRESLAGNEADLVGELGFGRRLAIVGDARTFAALGERVAKALAGRFDVQPIVLPGYPYPDDETVGMLRSATHSADALIAVGSGTINDLTKYSSALDNKPYAVFATAPSMNGYTSLTASISQHGHKLTLPAIAPVGAFFDLEVLANAPKRMIRAGLGDSICRSTAQTDWLLSHLLLDTPYRQLPYDLLAREEPALLDLADDLVRGSIEAMRVLVRTLILSGLGTAIVGSSAPASQAEHLVSHYLDMLSPADRPAVFHGEQVGVTTLSVARLQEDMLEHPPVLQPDRLTEADITSHFGEELGRSVWPEFAAKRLDAAKADELNHRIASGWSEVVSRLTRSFLPSSRIAAVLDAADAPVSPEAIHSDRAFYRSALLHAREIRNRFTVLDLLAASGRLTHLVSTV
ncbi:MAG TPA: sn-glycerol-1-phosphate dehydrogenase [Devosia sp.]|nr:sn-glycerol-1-phosphate dehydrogenase [Devosia sp.]